VVGLRPGEKLREELVAVDETLIAADVEKIMRVEAIRIPELEFMLGKIAELESLITAGQSEPLIQWLSEVVPTFRPMNGEVAREVSVSHRRPKKPASSRAWRVVTGHG
jgi:FlaA1/EpsC-like NDP-sugar epimerase